MKNVHKQKRGKNKRKSNKTSQSHEEAVYPVPF